MTTRMWCRCAADNDKADTRPTSTRTTADKYKDDADARPTSTRTTADKYKDDAGQLHFN